MRAWGWATLAISQRLREILLSGTSSSTLLLGKPLDALAFIGHGSVVNYKTPAEFSNGITFYYPLNPGKNTGDESSWDIAYPPPPGMTPPPPPQSLPGECQPPNNTCDDTLSPTQEVNTLLPMEKDFNTLVDLGGAWNYINSFVTGSPTPGPPHAPLLLVDKLAGQAKVIFIGACSLKPPLAQANELPVFLQMWDVHDQRFGQPENPTTSDHFADWQRRQTRKRGIGLSHNTPRFDRKRLYSPAGCG
jgi:hypothetical protein